MKQEPNISNTKFHYKNCWQEPNIFNKKLEPNISNSKRFHYKNCRQEPNISNSKRFHYKNCQQEPNIFNMKRSLAAEEMSRTLAGGLRYSNVSRITLTKMYFSPKLSGGGRDVMNSCSGRDVKNPHGEEMSRTHSPPFKVEGAIVARDCGGIKTHSWLNAPSLLEIVAASKPMADQAAAEGGQSILRITLTQGYSHRAVFYGGLQVFINGKQTKWWRKEDNLEAFINGKQTKQRWKEDNLETKQTTQALTAIMCSRSRVCTNLFSNLSYNMGMNNLWELLEPAAKTVPITLLALQDRYVGPAPHLPYVIGVDASGWFEQIPGAIGLLLGLWARDSTWFSLLHGQHVGTINSYAHPAVTSLAEVPKLQLPAPPDLAQLTCVIKQFLGWDSKKLLSAFCTTIWPVVILHELLEDVANNSPRSNEFSLASGCTRAVFLNHASCPKKMHRGISGHNTDVPIDMLEKATMQLLEEPAPGHRDDITSSHKIYDCWVKTMFLSLSGDLCTEVSAHPVSNFNSNSPASSSVTMIVN
ncbi:hypothetical protein BDR07DRAFT_1379656 [Suillus spraguei]|nr:hypothetical protein BDR07DRAFT_1379656 [Suillus spraguei]